MPAFRDWSKSEIIGALGVIAAFAAIAVGAITHVQNKNSQLERDAADEARRQADRQREEEENRPRLDDHGIDSPARPGPSNSCITFFNPGNRDLVLREIRFQYFRSFPTKASYPAPTASNQVPEFHIGFKNADLDREQKLFTKKVVPQQFVPAGKHLRLSMTIDEPGWLGNSYEGTVTVLYNKDEIEEFIGIVIDAGAPHGRLLRAP